MACAAARQRPARRRAGGRCAARGRRGLEPASAACHAAVLASTATANVHPGGGSATAPATVAAAHPAAEERGLRSTQRIPARVLRPSHYAAASTALATVVDSHRAEQGDQYPEDDHSHH